MALTRINKNNMLENFFLAVAAGQGFVEAGKKAGFTHVERDLARELHNPDFLPAMANAIRHRLGGRLALKAMGVAEALLNDKQVSARVRWDVAKTILAAGAGFVPPKAKEMEAPPQDISQMTAQDIMSLRESLNREMEQRSSGAKLIEHQPANESQQAETYSHLD